MLRKYPSSIKLKTEDYKKLENNKSTHSSNNIISNSHFSKTYLCHASGRGKGERGKEKKNSPLWRLRGRGDSLDPASHSSSAASALCRPKKTPSRPGRVLTLIPDTGGRPMAAFFFAIEGRVRKRGELEKVVSPQQINFDPCYSFSLHRGIEPR